MIEGPAEQGWTRLGRVERATLGSGAGRRLSVIKVSGSARAGGPRVEDLVRKFRP